MFFSDFISLYLFLGIIICLNVAILVLLIMLLKSKNEGKPKKSGNLFKKGKPMENFDIENAESFAMCKKCLTQYDTSLKKCPKCGTPRI